MPLKDILEDPITTIVRAKKPLSNGMLQPKTFFPNHWSVENILENAQEALLNITQLPTCSQNTYQLIGTTKNNIIITFNIDTTGNLISFYPQ